MLLVDGRAFEELSSHFGNQLRLLRLKNPRRSDDVVRSGRIFELELASEGLQRGVGMKNCEAPNVVIGLEDVDNTPCSELRHGESCDIRQCLLVVERRE